LKSVSGKAKERLDNNVFTGKNGSLKNVGIEMINSVPQWSWTKRIKGIQNFNALLNCLD